MYSNYLTNKSTISYQTLIIMHEFLYTLLIVFVVFILAFALLNIKHLFTGKEFSGTCASNNPHLRNEIGECPMCGNTGDAACENK